MRTKNLSFLQCCDFTRLELDEIKICRVRKIRLTLKRDVTREKEQDNNLVKKKGLYLVKEIK